MKCATMCVFASAPKYEQDQLERYVDCTCIMPILLYGLYTNEGSISDGHCCK